jgi:peptidoglycan/LPS O-acetylase OafA/YrhL
MPGRRDALFAAWIANMVAGGTVLPASHIFGPGYLIDTLCFALVVSGLSSLPPHRFGPLVERIDRTLGEWSYFAFLGHWLAGFLVAGLFFNGDWRGWTLLLAATPVMLAASAVLAWLNRIFVEPFRSRVRSFYGPYRPATPAAGAERNLAWALAPRQRPTPTEISDERIRAQRRLSTPHETSIGVKMRNTRTE